LREVRDGLKTLFSVNLNLTGEEERSLVSSFITRVGTFDTLATDRLLDINTSIASLKTATQDVRKGVVDAIDQSKAGIMGGLSRIENKLPSTVEKLFGGGAGLLGLFGGLPVALGGFLAGLFSGGGTAEERIEENTRYTAGALLGPAGVVLTLREFLPNLKLMRDDFFDTTAPWMAEMSDLLRDGTNAALSEISERVLDIKNILTLPSPLVFQPASEVSGGYGRNITINLNGPIANRTDADYMLDQISRNLR
jgi:hypothetical protein